MLRYVHVCQCHRELALRSCKMKSSKQIVMIRQETITQSIAHNVDQYQCYETSMITASACWNLEARLEGWMTIMPYHHGFMHHKGEDIPRSLGILWNSLTLLDAGYFHSLYIHMDDDLLLYTGDNHIRIAAKGLERPCSSHLGSIRRGAGDPPCVM